MSAQDIANALPSGYTLHEYRIEKMLGAGGFGLTYLAHDANLNTKVAIKEYLPTDFAARSEDESVQPKNSSEQETFDWGLKRFLDESRALASFRHPNIVRVMRFFEANHTAYMVMEFIAGKPLNEWVTSHFPLDHARITGIALPLLDGLEVIHSADYLHRDIKPQNIFIRDDGDPVLIDFGSARMTVKSDQNMTIIVTPGFAPLEQYHAHGNQGPWTDVYSLAGVLYWLVTGKKPVEAAARVREDIMPSAVDSAEPACYSPSFLAAIDWALKPHEKDRPQSVAEWRIALTGGGSVAPAAILQKPARTLDASATNLPPSSIFDRNILKRIESELAPHVGPIAAVIVKNAAKRAATFSELLTLVAPEVPGDTQRAAFIKKLGSDTSTLLSNPQADSAPSGLFAKISSTAPKKFGDDTLRQAELALAQHIGAVATIVVKRAAKKARNESELYLLIADEIEDKVEKRNFIRKALSVSGKP